MTHLRTLSNHELVLYCESTPPATELFAELLHRLARSCQLVDFDHKTEFQPSTGSRNMPIPGIG
jgi:hypothetical protein